MTNYQTFVPVHLTLFSVQCFLMAWHLLLTQLRPGFWPIVCTGLNWFGISFSRSMCLPCGAQILLSHCQYLNHISCGEYYCLLLIPGATFTNKHGLTLIPAWICNNIHYKVWDEITYLFPNFNGVTVEVWEWISNFIPYFAGYVITYPCWD